MVHHVGANDGFEVACVGDHVRMVDVLDLLQRIDWEPLKKFRNVNGLQRQAILSQSIIFVEVSKH